MMFMVYRLFNMLCKAIANSYIRFRFLDDWNNNWCVCGRRRCTVSFNHCDNRVLLSGRQTKERRERKITLCTHLTDLNLLGSA